MAVRRMLRLVLLWCLVSCGRPEDGLLRQAERVADSCPEAAARLLDSLEGSGRLVSGQWARYYFLRCHISFLREGRVKYFFPSEETALRWEREGERQRAAYLWLYKGVTCARLRSPEEAAICLDRAQALAGEVRDSLLSFYVYYHKGRLLFRNREFSRAGEQLREALRCHPRDTSRGYSHYWLKVGECSLHCDDSRTAERYYRLAMEKIDSGREALQAARGVRHFMDHARGPEERGQLREYIEGYGGEERYARVCRQLVGIGNLLKEQRTDSAGACLARLYADTLWQSPELGMLYNRLFGTYLYQSGAYREAAEVFHRQMRLKDSLQAEAQRHRLMQVVSGYRQMRLEGEVRELQWERRGLLSGMLVVVLSGAVAALWIARQRNRKARRLAEAEQLAETLKEMNRRLQERHDDSKSLLMRELDIAKQLALLAGRQLPEHASFLEMYNGMLGHIRTSELDWEKFYKLIDCLFDGFCTRVWGLSPELSEKDVRLLCLMRGGFKTDEIAFAMKTNLTTVHKRRTTVRKKLGMEGRTDLLEAIEERLREK